jgi:hypothetical protein
VEEMEPDSPVARSGAEGGRVPLAPAGETSTLTSTPVRVNRHSEYE